MKICVSLVLLTLLCPGGCPVYDFDLKTIQQPSQFANGLKLAADLNSEYNQGLMNYHVLGDKERSKSTTDDADSTCKLNALGSFSPSANVEEYPTRKFQFSRRAEDDDYDMELEDFVGSNLFDSTRKKCFSPEDLNLLSARRDFEYLIPKDLPKCLLNDDMLNMLLNYFYNGNELIQRMPEYSRRVAERAYYDMLGGYLRSYLLPAAKYSYYGGKASLKVVSSVEELYQQCKSFLNTRGNGWRMPILLEEMDNVHVEPLQGSDCGYSDGYGNGNGVGSGQTGCARLEMLPANDGDENIMLVAMPKLEADYSENRLSNLWLPFRKRRNYDIRSPKSAYVIMRFYAAVTRCYQTQSIPQNTFNAKFVSWINENIKPHLSDEEFYPGLGGVLKIVEKLRKGRKALDYEYDDDRAIAVERKRNDISSVLHNDDVAADSVGGVNSRQNDDGFSDMELAKKALEYKTQEKIKQTAINSKRWFERNGHEHNDNKNNNNNNNNNNDNMNNINNIKDMFSNNNKPDRQLKSRKICEKPKNQLQKTTLQQQHAKHNKATTKKKCKQKGGAKHGGSSLMSYTSDQKKRYLKYLCCIIGFILFILLIILLIVMLRRNRKRKPTIKTTEPKPPKRRRKCPAWCSFLWCRKKPAADEEILIKPETKSVIATQPQRRTSTSTSSLACQPASKCIPCSKRPTKESEGAAVIETTSLDYYSSSEAESKSRNVKSKAKGKQKVVKIDEKKKKDKKSTSPSPTKSKSKQPTIGKSSSPTKGGSSSRLGGGGGGFGANGRLETSSSSWDGTKRLGIQRTTTKANDANKKSSSEMDVEEIQQGRQQHNQRQHARSVSRDRSKGSRSWETMYDSS